MLQQKLFFICILAFVCLLQNQKVEGVRLCGRRLADLLNFICKSYGGFHSPGENNADPNTSQEAEVAGSLLYTSDPRNKRGSAVDMESGIIFLSKRSAGIVDECCKKQCSRTTLLSYCAGAPFPVNDDFFLDEEVSSSTDQENTNNLHIDEQNLLNLDQQTESTSFNGQPSPLGTDQYTPNTT